MITLQYSSLHKPVNPGVGRAIDNQIPIKRGEKKNLFYENICS